MEFNAKQQEQESEYDIPYHWFLERDAATERSRIYFGYLDTCSDAAPGADAVILDAGCGDARFLGLLRDRGYRNLHGIDYSERAISFARLLLPEVNFKVGEFARMPFADNSMDVIFCIETIEHLVPNTISGVIAEFKRVLKPGGLLVITVPSLHNGVPAPGSKHYQHFSPKSLSSYLTPFFKIESIEGQDKVGFHPFKVIYRPLDNPFWDLKELRRYYNLIIWPRVFNRCSPEMGRRLIARCRKGV